MTTPIDGVACPTITPLRDGSVDTESLRAHVRWLVDNGIEGLVPCGTTGEFASLTDDERATVVNATVEAAADRVPVLAGAGDTTVDGAARRVDHVVAAGADAALVPRRTTTAAATPGYRRSSSGYSTNRPARFPSTTSRRWLDSRSLRRSSPNSRPESE